MGCWLWIILVKPSSNRLRTITVDVFPSSSRLEKRKKDIEIIRTYALPQSGMMGIFAVDRTDNTK